jgi:hypothetical protein
MRAAAAGVFAVTLAGCSAGMTGAPQRPDVSGCDADDFATGKVVFFGLTNNLGPGTIMKRYAGNGIGPEVPIGSLVADQTSASAVVHRGVDWTCALGDSLARAFNANGALGILPVDADRSAKLARALRIDVTVDSVRWDDLLVGPYRVMVDRLSDAGVKADLLGGRDLIVSRAFAAKGIKITALFDRSTGASAKAALGEGAHTFTQGKVTAIVNLGWEGTTKLVMTTPSEVYIAGQFRRFGTGISRSGDGTMEATDPPVQRLVRAGL